jgi:hypothetical protein
MKDVTFFDCFHTRGDDVSLLAPALTIGIIKPHRAIFVPGRPTTLDQNCTIKSAQLAHSAHNVPRPFLQAPRPLTRSRGKFRYRALNDGDEFNLGVILVILVHSDLPQWSFGTV